MSKTYKVKNWHKFQHYKDRRPPWIKLHREILDDPDYFALPDKMARQLPLIWLMASETNDGSLPNVKAMAFRLRISVSECEKVIDGLLHYLTVMVQDASDVLADGLHVAVPETEGERESEEETDMGDKKTPYGEFKKVLLSEKDYLKLSESYGSRLNDAIDILDSYLENYPKKKYASHYAVMKKNGWVWERAFEEKKQVQLRNPSTRVGGIGNDPSFNL